MLQLSKDIKFVVSDFDGVFTDGSIYISEKNEVQKRMNFKDIMGVSMLLKKGINFGIISGEKSNILDYFKDKFNLVEIHGGIRQKGIVLDEIMKKYNLKSNEVLYIGDDINDIAAMELVDYRIAPKNLNPILPFKVNNLQITDNYGGNGAIREIADILVNME
ncbi:MAG: HAD hydrolase family protein [Candidatus Gastranaerophilales bacterium]|nr:HAD hydrolase family protein [Candidatus Gastranaerophilales bacterium]